MTQNSIAVLNYMKLHFGQEISKETIANDVGISLPAVQCSMMNYCKRNLVTERVEEVVVEPAVPATETTHAKKEKVKKNRFYTLTEAGLAFDPEAYEAERAAIKAAAKPAKRAEKANAM